MCLRNRVSSDTSSDDFHACSRYLLTFWGSIAGFVKMKLFFAFDVQNCNANIQTILRIFQQFHRAPGVHRAGSGVGSDRQLHGGHQSQFNLITLTDTVTDFSRVVGLLGRGGRGRLGAGSGRPPAGQSMPSWRRGTAGPGICGDI